MSEKTATFVGELKDLLNRYSIENKSNTPDFILAEYLHRCLDNWAITSFERERWYGKHMKPGQP